MNKLNKPMVKKILLTFVNIALIGAILAFVAGVGLIVYYIQSAPELTEESLTATTSSKIYDKDGNLIADLGTEKRENASTEEIPSDLVNAIISIEDHRFFDHRGIDVIRIAGALLNNLTGNNLQGGSTLDQQFIKLTYFSTSTQDQTLKRKVQEAWLAIQLERRNTKQEILTYYVNKVYMSNGNYGMKTAASSYYGKELKDLSLAQLALLSGMPQAPNQYDPYTQPEAAKERRDLVLSEMLEEAYISQEQYETAVATDVSEGLLPLTTEAAYPAYMDNYIKEVIEEVETNTGYNLLTTGMDVYTNVDTTAQQLLWNIYNSSDYVTYPDDSLQVASTVVDVTSGKVVAQLGSRFQESGVSFGINQAVETNRDWGSTMKPITDYAPAIENGIFTSTADTIADTAYNYPGTTTPVYNWDRSYYGNITIKSAIQYSRNVPAVKSLEKVGLDKATAFLSNIGIHYPELHYSNAISSNTSETGNEYGASSEKMAAAYASFANGGTYYAPQYVNKIVFSDGTTTEYTPEGTRVMSEATAYMMTHMMKSVLEVNYGVYASVNGVPLAGKTGTSNYSDSEVESILAAVPEANYSSMIAPDENFVGYSTKYSMAVWTGYSNRMTPILDDGMAVATSVFQAMMSHLNPSATATDWEMPSSVFQYGSYIYKEGATPQYSYTTTTTSQQTSDSTTQSSATEPSSAAQNSTPTNEQTDATQTGQ